MLPRKPGSLVLVRYTFCRSFTSITATAKTSLGEYWHKYTKTGKGCQDAAASARQDRRNGGLVNPWGWGVFKAEPRIFPRLRPPPPGQLPSGTSPHRRGNAPGRSLPLRG